MQRRTFLHGLLATGLGATWLKSWAEAAVSTPGQLPRGAPLQPLSRLVNQAQDSGIFRATLVAAPADIALFPGQTTRFWAYNGALPGPLIEVFEGDQLDITLDNRLEQPTTIHWHGLPVPPEQDGNPQRPVEPGTQTHYRFTLPPGSAGTYWYHPHPHQQTAEQVFRGLAGPLIVRARQDPLGQIAERLLLVSDLKTGADGQIADNDSDDWMNGREGQYVLVNGQLQPALQFDRHGRERWRIWNACSARYLRLQLPETPLTLVGTDGGLLQRAVGGLHDYLLAPGQRIELIVEAGSRRDRATLLAAPYERGKMGDVAPEAARILLTVDFSTVTDAPATALPPTLRDIAALGPARAHKQVVFSEAMQGDDMLFLVNGKQYAMQRIDLRSRVHEVEQWDIVNRSDMDHPFHLHGTQFQIVQRVLDGKTTPAPYLAWHDTVNLQAGETVRINTVQHWPGLRMFHCHILEHEDRGMMGQLEVV